MSDQNIPSFLDEDLSSVDTSMPILTEGLYDLKVAEVTIGQNKAQTGQTAKIKFETTTTARSKDGQDVQPGFPIFHNIGLTPSPDYTEEMIKRNVAALAQAAGVPNIFPEDRIKGKIVQVKMKIEPERTDKKTGVTYAEANRIARFVIPPKK